MNASENLKFQASKWSHEKQVRQAIRYLDSGFFIQTVKQEYTNQEIADCLQETFGVRMSTGEISDIQWIIDHPENM